MPHRMDVLRRKLIELWTAPEFDEYALGEVIAEMRSLLPPELQGRKAEASIRGKRVQARRKAERAAALAAQKRRSP